MRTLAPVAFGFQLGIMAAPIVLLGQASPWVAMAVFAVGATFAVARATASLASSALLAFGAGLAGLAMGPPPSGPSALPPSGMARMTAVVEETQHGKDDEARSRIRVLRGARVQDGAAIPSGTELWVHPYALPEGATLELLANVAPRVRFRNPSPHPELPLAHETHGHASLPTSDAFKVLSRGWASQALDAVRSRTRERMRASLSATAGAVACALILGDPDTLEDEDRDDVRASGLSHVFAVSGMHVTLLAGSCVLALSWLLTLIQPLAARFDMRRVASALGVPLALAIAAITGGAPSGWRAAITSAIAWCVIAFGRKPDARAVMAAACLVFAAVAPSDALRPAFLLSVAATAAIVSAPRPSEPTLAAGLRSALLLCVRTTLATAPIVLWTFGNLPIAGVIANLVLVPLGSVLLVVCAGHALLAVLVPPSAFLSAPLVALGSRAFLAGCHAFAELGPRIAWPVLDAPQGLVLCSAVAALLVTTGWRAVLRTSALALLCLVLLELRLRMAEHPQDLLRATFLDVGQGDAALVDLPDGSALLIDAGGNPEGGADPGERVLLPLLAARRRARIELAVLSHPHPDHYGGLAAILQAMPITELWDSGQAEAELAISETGAAAAKLLAQARARGTRVVQPARLCGAEHAFGGATLEALWPCPGYDAGYDPNDNSLVLRIHYGLRAFLFTGDIEAHAESELLTRAQRGLVDLRADVLKVAHHGSRTSTSAAWLAAVRPSIAIVSAGAVNRFGHPHDEVRARLAAGVREVIDLGQRGGVMVTSDGSDLRVGSDAFITRARDYAPILPRSPSPPAARSCSANQNEPKLRALEALPVTSADASIGDAQSR